MRWLADLYAAQAHLISSFPQLDLQNQFRESTSYHSSGAGAVHACLDFLAVHPKTLLCYLHQAYKPLDILLQALASLQASSMNVVLVCPGLVPAAVEKLRQAGIAASSETVNLEQAMASCDWFLGHGGIGTLTQAMRLGKPTILMPMHLEQLHNALQVQKAGLGQVIPEQQQAQAYLKLLSSITARTELIQQASAFAAANRQYSEPRLEVAIREQVEAILR